MHFQFFISSWIIVTTFVVLRGHQLIGINSWDIRSPRKQWAHSSSWARRWNSCCELHLFWLGENKLEPKSDASCSKSFTVKLQNIELQPVWIVWCVKCTDLSCWLTTHTVFESLKIPGLNGAVGYLTSQILSSHAHSVEKKNPNTPGTK